jgi:hypothetical protein
MRRQQADMNAALGAQLAEMHRGSPAPGGYGGGLSSFSSAAPTSLTAALQRRPFEPSAYASGGRSGGLGSGASAALLRRAGLASGLASESVAATPDTRDHRASRAPSPPSVRAPSPGA